MISAAPSSPAPPNPTPPPSNGRRDPWSKSEIIAALIGAVLVPLGGWIAFTLTTLQVEVGVINQRLDGIDGKLASIDKKLGELENWRLDHITDHAPKVSMSSDEAPSMAAD